MIMRITETIKHLIIINAIMFAIGSFQLIPNFSQWMAFWFIKNPNFHYWQFITHIFMHANLAHFFFNMFALWSFGTVLEQIWGGKKLLFFFMSCGLGAALLHLGVNYYHFERGVQSLVDSGVDPSSIYHLLEQGKYSLQWEKILSNSEFQDMTSAYFSPAVGASGAIYGILVAFGTLFPNARLMLIFLPIAIRAKYFIPILIFGDLFLGISHSSFLSSGMNIAHFAHIGGALTGFILCYIWGEKQRQI